MVFYELDRELKKDFTDSIAEYGIYNRSNCDNTGNSKSVSGFGLGLSALITFVTSAAIACTLGIEGITLVLVFIILCVTIGGFIAWVSDEIGF